MKQNSNSQTAGPDWRNIPKKSRTMLLMDHPAVVIMVAAVSLAGLIVLTAARAILWSYAWGDIRLGLIFLIPASVFVKLVMKYRMRFYVDYNAMQALGRPIGRRWLERTAYNVPPILFLLAYGLLVPFTMDRLLGLCMFGLLLSIAYPEQLAIYRATLIRFTELMSTSERERPNPVNEGSKAP
jgi:hypothetical protein